MANRFSDIAKQMGAPVDDEAGSDGIEEKSLSQQNTPSGNTKTAAAALVTSPPKRAPQKNSLPLSPPPPAQEIPTTRKTTALPLVLDIAIKEVKERRNIVNKIKRAKKITEDDVIVEALELYFRKAENKSCLEAAYDKIKLYE